MNPSLLMRLHVYAFCYDIFEDCPVPVPAAAAAAGVLGNEGPDYEGRPCQLHKALTLFQCF